MGEDLMFCAGAAVAITVTVWLLLLLVEPLAVYVRHTAMHVLPYRCCSAIYPEFGIRYIRFFFYRSCRREKNRTIPYFACEFRSVGFFVQLKRPKFTSLYLHFHSVFSRKLFRHQSTVLTFFSSVAPFLFFSFFYLSLSCSHCGQTCSPCVPCDCCCYTLVLHKSTA